ncbi:MAG: UDP-N-acetylmuramoyl-L-alanyl-D-glutamate--2,6-diaminopimelate ligase [Pseudomonadota bacterium]|nr:UDP-N-acetylmuramoyl-L-alanyl-D-glutamate--2,6-diaminopimelate ligase [Pseudomonadota bacterium]
MQPGPALPSGLPALLTAMQGLTADSRRVRPGMGFAAYPGDSADGRDYIADALARGASALLWEPQGFAGSAAWPVPHLAVPGLGGCISRIADAVYGAPSAALQVIGVTGTNGKTTSTSLIAQLFGAAGRRCGIVGTLGAGFPEALVPTGFTTPGPVELQAQLAALRDQGAVAVAMEVSSHGLALGRVDGVRFELAVFTNLTRDHLDFHASMEDYAAAKTALFHAAGLRLALINVDDPFGARLHAELREAGVAVQACTQHDHVLPAADTIRARAARFRPDGTAFELVTPAGSVAIDSPLVGRFNLANLLGVLAVALASGIALTQLPALVAGLTPPPGRLERLGLPGGVQVVIDYAHTPDALEQVLHSLRASLAGGRLICLFGCGGDRDPGKRPLMGAVAGRLADLVVLTSDNPRSEPPGRILDEVVAGMQAAPAACMVDRAAAIAHAIALARPGDVVLVAGKGHETTQEIAGVRHPFSDHDEVRRVLGLTKETP